MYLIIILVILLLLGASDAVYLIYKNRPGQALVCPLNTSCHAVLKSKWNKFLGVRNEIWGILYYLGIFCLILLYLYNFIGANILLITVSFGVFYSAVLTYVQIFKIKEYCPFCLFSAIINVLIFLTTLIIYL